MIAPEIALAHAKPDESVLQDDIVLMICQSPVTFYSHNDPVTLLFGLCATSGDKHMDNIVMMAELLSDEDVLFDDDGAEEGAQDSEALGGVKEEAASTDNDQGGEDTSAGVVAIPRGPCALARPFTTVVAV